MVRSLVELGLGLRSFFAVNKVSLLGPKCFYSVKHQPEDGIFYVSLNTDDARAVLTYKLNGKVMDLRHVIVPKKYGGRGVAKVLTEAAFNFALRNKYNLYLTCPFTRRHFLKYGNKEVQKIVVGPKEVLSQSE